MIDFIAIGIQGNYETDSIEKISRLDYADILFVVPEAKLLIRDCN